MRRFESGYRTDEIKLLGRGEMTNRLLRHTEKIDMMDKYDECVPKQGEPRFGYDFDLALLRSIYHLSFPPGAKQTSSTTVNPLSSTSTSSSITPPLTTYSSKPAVLFPPKGRQHPESLLKFQ